MTFSFEQMSEFVQLVFFLLHISHGKEPLQTALNVSIRHLKVDPHRELKCLRYWSETCKDNISPEMLYYSSSLKFSIL